MTTSPQPIEFLSKGLRCRGLKYLLCLRLLGRPASESGTLCHGDGAQGRGDRLRRSFMLPILSSPLATSTLPPGGHARIAGENVRRHASRPGHRPCAGRIMLRRWRAVPFEALAVHTPTKCRMRDRYNYPASDSATWPQSQRPPFYLPGPG